MIIDNLQNSGIYSGLGPRIEKAFSYLKSTDFFAMKEGRYEIDGENLIAMLSEYDTKSAKGEKMESHRKYIDVQYMVKGVELMGYSAFTGQHPSVPYDAEKDFMLFEEEPSSFVLVKQGMFTIFFPTDLHMPTILSESAARVKKVVMKVRIE